MTQFLDVRLSDVGGDLARSVATFELTNTGTYQTILLADLQSSIAGRHVLIATHGFNVNRPRGRDALSKWEGLVQVASPFAFVGLLWPGDSVWAHGLDYPAEPKIANKAGALIASFIDTNFAGAASISFVSHSLGARLVLQAVSSMTRPVRRVTLMAGAIDNVCLRKEFKSAVAKIGEISVLASENDEVLSLIFPFGNFFAGIIAAGHPWWRGALGKEGPSPPAPTNFRPPFQIPNNWDYGHGDYLRVDPPAATTVPVPTDVPPNGARYPAGGALGWQQAWSAAFESTRFQ